MGIGLDKESSQGVTLLLEVGYGLACCATALTLFKELLAFGFRALSAMGGHVVLNLGN